MKVSGRLLAKKSKVKLSRAKEPKYPKERETIMTELSLHTV